MTTDTPPTWLAETPWWQRAATCGLATAVLGLCVGFVLGKGTRRVEEDVPGPPVYQVLLPRVALPAPPPPEPLPPVETAESDEPLPPEAQQ